MSFRKTIVEIPASHEWRRAEDQRIDATLLKRNAVAVIANQTPPDRWPEARARLLAATSSPTVIDTLNA